MSRGSAIWLEALFLHQLTTIQNGWDTTIASLRPLSRHKRTGLKDTKSTPVDPSIRSPTLLYETSNPLGFAAG
jgi:hypothetical protein